MVLLLLLLLLLLDWPAMLRLMEVKNSGSNISLALEIIKTKTFGLYFRGNWYTSDVTAIHKKGHWKHASIIDQLAQYV